MIGFVFRSPALLPNQLSLVRYVVSCCSADALPYGVMCEVKDGGKYKEDQWLQVQGIVQMGKYEDRPVAMIKVVSAKQIQPPENPYIFPPSQ